MLSDICEGMKYISGLGYVHRDLAARNILINGKGTCKISDFGLARKIGEKFVDDAYTLSNGKVPIRWTAPEAVMYRRFTIASDVWSFGVVGWEIFTHGERPYWDWTNQAVISMLERGYRLPCPHHCPPEVFGLISECWLSEADKRPEFSKITVRLQAILKEDSPTLKNHRTQNVELIRRPEVAEPTKLKLVEWNGMECSGLQRKEGMEDRISKLYSLKCSTSGKLPNQMDTSSLSKCQQNGYNVSVGTPLFVDLSPLGQNLTSSALYFNINPKSLALKERYSSLPRVSKNKYISENKTNGFS
ncbi:hypothetical protein EG68_00513 [Paragonimus skrjabini miyazakii]|uniref:Protein kinase domain-containing protein n=1 Tax=Paragonimus skrjabini miyazakii TaxID=59628 RepID=A0A8S9ZCB5_9TREM|nr:hypothetical protein EG68_00513 [Paragonimus skrjabini miyazakii]